MTLVYFISIAESNLEKKGWKFLACLRHIEEVGDENTVDVSLWSAF